MPPTAAPCLGHSTSEVEKLHALIQQRWHNICAVWTPTIYAGQPDPEESGSLAWTIPAYEFLGAGVSRVAYGLCSEHVLKVDFGAYGPLQNRDEYRFWNLVGPQTKELLTPIFQAAADGSWILVGRCAPLPQQHHHPSSRANQRALQQLIHIFENPLTEIGIADVSADNCGLYHGRLVVLDYGAANGLTGSEKLDRRGAKQFEDIVYAFQHDRTL